MRQRRSLGDLRSPYWKRASILSLFANEGKTGRRTNVQLVGMSVLKFFLGIGC